MPDLTQCTHTMIAVVLGMTCAIALAGETKHKPGSPHHLATQFCDYYQARNLDERYADIVTTSLHRRIADVELKNRVFSYRHPGDKPPLGDGLPFQSVLDRGSCHTGTVSASAGRVVATVSYDLGDGVPIRDQLVTVREKRQWKIDDILFGPAHTDSMRTHLRAMAQRLP